MIARMIDRLVPTPLLRCLRDEAAGVAVVFGLALVPLIGSVGVAIDVSVWYGERGRLQAAVDSAAIAAAREMRVANTTPAQLEQIAEAIATASAQARGFAPDGIEVHATVDPREHSVHLTISRTLDRVFSRVVTDTFTNVTVAATARVSGSAPICVVGLDRTEAKTIVLENRAVVDARGCAVYSNSDHNQGMRVGNFAQLNAALICSAGGKSGPFSAFSTTPRTDCPPLPDPLADREPPAVASCSHHDLVVERDRFLSPGVFCGGLKIVGGAQVTLGAGLYVIKDGKLEVGDGSALRGEYVSFHFIGNNALLEFESKSTIDLSAMRNGVLAGILFFEDRSAPVGRDFKIESDDARNLLGTIYLPRGDLLVRADRPVADRSAFTVIVARKLELEAGPTLTLNTDYHRTDIPVPDGVGPTGDVILSE